MAPPVKGQKKPAQAVSSDSVKKRKSKKLYSLYEKSGDKVKLKTKLCPKCSSYMGKHKDRYACGKCKYTEKI